MPVNLITGTSNRGPAHARNYLLRHVRADYVHFHDSDDLFHPEWAARVHEVICQRTGVDAVFTDVLFTKPDGSSAGKLGIDKLRAAGDLLSFCIGGAIPVPAGTYRKQLLLEMGGYPEDIQQSEDYAFHIRLAARSKDYALIEDPLAIVRGRASSWSRSNSGQVFRDGLTALKRLKGEVPDRYSTEMADAAIRFARILYQLGDVSGAEEGFKCAYKLGTPSYRFQRAGFRSVAKLMGPIRAERVAALYRRFSARWTGS